MVKSYNQPDFEQDTNLPTTQAGLNANRNGRRASRGNGKTPTISPPNPLAEFFNPDPRFAPPKSLASRPWGTWLLTIVGVMVVVSVMMVLVNALTRDIGEVEQTVITSSGDVVSAVQNELKNLPQSTVDLSTIEAQLDTIIQQNQFLMTQSGTLEAQLIVGLNSMRPPLQATPVIAETTPAVAETTPAVAETTPVIAETTPATSLSVDDLDINQVILKTTTPFHFVPHVAQGSQAILQQDTIVTVQGIFTDRDNIPWLVIRPARELGLQINTPDEKAFYDRPQVFVKFDLQSVQYRDISQQPVPLELTLVNQRKLRRMPEVKDDNILKDSISSIRALDAIRDEKGDLSWIRVDITDLDISPPPNQTYGFVIFFTQNNNALSGTDLEIANRLPDTPGEFRLITAQPTAVPSFPFPPPQG